MNLTSVFEVRFPRRSRSPTSLRILTGLLAGVPFAGLSPARADEARLIDKEKSTMTVHAYKGGALGVFGHDHEIAAPIAGGAVDTAGRHVELRVNAATLRVRDSKASERDSKASEKDRADIQKTMLGPDVLDAERHREILFK